MNINYQAWQFYSRLPLSLCSIKIACLRLVKRTQSEKCQRFKNNNNNKMSINHAAVLKIVKIFVVDLAASFSLTVWNVIIEIAQDYATYNRQIYVG